MNGRVTSPAHGLALGMYAFTTVLGLAHITNVADAKALAEYFGPAGSVTWASLMIAGGAWTLFSSIMFQRTKLAGWILREVSGLILIGAVYTIYVGSLIAYYGLLSSPTTKLMGTAIAAGCFVRIIQAVLEIRRNQRTSA